jgi:hypothetical protein
MLMSGWVGIATSGSVRSMTDVRESGAYVTIKQTFPIFDIPRAGDAKSLT